MKTEAYLLVQDIIEQFALVKCPREAINDPALPSQLRPSHAHGILSSGLTLPRNLSSSVLTISSMSSSDTRPDVSAMNPRISPWSRATG